MIRLSLPLITLFVCTCFKLSSQAVTAGFSLPDTVCINTPVNITNTSSGASSYYWNFCSGNLNTTPEATNLGNIGNVLSTPVFTDVMEENGHYYVFCVNHYPGSLVKLDFGNSLLNTPVATNMGNFGGVINAGYGSEGIQVVNNDGKWYVFIIGGYPVSQSIPKLVKISFGASLANNSPIATDYGNIGDLLQPIDLQFLNQNGQWYGFTVNASNNTLTRFDFSTSLENAPKAVNLGNIGELSYPTGLFAIKDQNSWLLFVANGNSSSLTRLDFGSDLASIPVPTILGNPNNTFDRPRDISIVRSCDQITGFVVNTDERITQLDFNNDIRSVPSAVSLGNIGTFSFPHSLSKLFRVGPDLFTFITNAYNSTITRLRFAGCSSSTVKDSDQKNPPTFAYTKPGVYKVSLLIDEGLPTQTSFCKTITAIAPPDAVPVKDTSLCESQLTLRSRFEVQNTWNTGLVSDTLLVTTSGTYAVTGNYHGCSITDIFSCKLNALPAFTLGKDTSICQGDTLVLQSPLPQAVNVWQDGMATPLYKAHKPGQYWLTITTNEGCSSKDSILVSTKPRPYVKTLNDTTVCEGAMVVLATQSTGFAQLNWHPVTGLSNPSIASPVLQATGNAIYQVSALLNGCTAADTLQLKVLPKPVVNVSADTLICIGGMASLTAAGGVTYNWFPLTGLTGAQTSNPSAAPAGSTHYQVQVTGSNGCSSTDSVLVQVKPVQKVVITPLQASICNGDTVVLSASGSDGYQWLSTEIANIRDSIVRVHPAVTTVYQLVSPPSVCRRTDTISSRIVVRPLPVTSLAKSGDIDCTTGESVLTATGGTRYQWFPAGTLSDSTTARTIARTDSTTFYYVRVTAANGCSKTDSLQVQVNRRSVVNGYPVVNAFTPNGDGLNDCFRIKYWGYTGQFELQVFDRWGKRVFVTHNPGDGWDGTYNGRKQPSGTYVYYIQAKALCGNVIRKGTVVLVR